MSAVAFSDLCAKDRTRTNTVQMNTPEPSTLSLSDHAQTGPRSPGADDDRTTHDTSGQPGVIVHLVPDFVNNDEYGAGNWKAAEASRISLEKLGGDLRVLQIDSNSPLSCLASLPREVTDFYIEYSFFPELLVRLRAHFPDARVHVRTVNAEALQYFVRQRRRSVDVLRPGLWKGTARILWRDMRSRQLAHSLAGINEWDDKYYWRLLPGKSKVDWVPYYSPWPMLRPQVAVGSWADREPTVVSFGGNFDPSGEANFRNFDRLATGFADLSQEHWSFVLTWWSQWHDRVPEVSPNVTIVRNLEEPWDLLCKVRALAVLTPYGYGFKTSIVDGLAAGCHVIVHPRLAPRVPNEIRALCLIGDPAVPEDVKRLTKALVEPPAPHNLNDQLAERALAQMKKRFKLTERSAG